MNTEENAAPVKWRTRHGITDGRIYSVLIAVVVVALLAPSLTHWKPVAALKPLSGVTFQHPVPVTAAPVPAAPPTPAAAPLTSSTALNGFSLGPVAPFPTGTISTPPLLTAPPTSSSLPPAVTCAAAALNAETAKLLTELDASLKVLPTSTIETTLGLATGCNTANPALVAVGALSELGDDLTIAFGEIPGASALKFPTVKPIELPAALLPLLSSLEPVFSSICADINTATDAVILIAPHYPQVVDGASALALFQAAVTCEELTGAGGKSG